MLDDIELKIKDQLVRSDYPTDFPPLPGIPAARYYDPVFAETELRQMWMRTWLFAALESELAEPGSYILFKQLGQSVIIMCGRDGIIRAFHNSCRHRATALLHELKGTVARITCPYHAWSYDREGRLLALPMAKDFCGLDKSQRELSPVRCELWRGLVFINFDVEAGGVADFMAPTAGRIDDFPLEALVAKDHFSVLMDCNWKLAYHNFLEAYHLASVHPNSLAPHLDADAFLVSLYGNGHSRLAARKREGKSASIYKSEAKTTDQLGEVYRRFSITIPTFPNFSAALDVSGFAIQTFWPCGPTKSIMDVRLVGWADSPADSEYWSALRGVADGILDEDLGLFARIQEGVETSCMPELTMGCQEKALYWFEEEMDRRIGASHVPERMRVSQLLAGQTES